MGHSNLVTNPETIQALQELYAERGKLLKPLDVVEAARPETSPLHRHFEWDDGKAADRFRIEQARSLIQRVYVRLETPDGKGRMAQAFVSLTTDRQQGGYRATADVFSDNDMRNQLIRDVLAEMQLFEERYKQFRELAGVFSAMKKAKKKLAAV